MRLSAAQSNVLKHMAAGWTLGADLSAGGRGDHFMRLGTSTQTIPLDVVVSLLELGLIRKIALHPTVRYTLSEAGRIATRAV